MGYCIFCKIIRGVITGGNMIRTAILSDSSQIAYVLTETWKTAYKGLIDPDYLKKLNQDFFTNIMMQNITLEREKIFVFEIDGKVAGFISGKDNHSLFEVIGLYVYPDYQGNGIGRKLLEQIKQYAKSQNCTELLIKILDGAKNNSFYLGNGLIRKRVFALEIDGKEYDGIEFMEKI